MCEGRLFDRWRAFVAMRVLDSHFVNKMRFACLGIRREPWRTRRRNSHSNALAWVEDQRGTPEVYFQLIDPARDERFAPLIAPAKRSSADAFRNRLTVASVFASS